MVPRPVLLVDYPLRIPIQINPLHHPALSWCNEREIDPYTASLNGVAVFL